jgi:hypothetical protein
LIEIRAVPSVILVFVLYVGNCLFNSSNYPAWLRVAHSIQIAQDNRGTGLNLKIVLLVGWEYELVDHADTRERAGRGRSLLIPNWEDRTARKN